MLFGSKRSANVETVTYSTMTRISAESFKKICHNCPGFYWDLKDYSLKYDDEWTKFKVVLLK